MKGYKGFDEKLRCNGFQYEAGKEYEHKGEVKCCSEGFHFCENPMDVLCYYPPSSSRYCEVDGSGKTDKEVSDSKVACSKIKIGAEIGIRGLIEAGVKFILERVDWKNAKITNTGDRSAATNTGYRSAATNTGYRSAAVVEGKESVAIATGYESKAKGSLGCWLVLAEWDEAEHIIDVQCVKVDGEKIKADTYYLLSNGNFVEAKKRE